MRQRKQRVTCRVEFENHDGLHTTTVRIPKTVTRRARAPRDSVTKRELVDLIKAKTGDPVYTIYNYECGTRHAPLPRRRK